MARHPREPVWCGIAYAALVAWALILAIQPNGDGTGGLWSTLLAMPWSLMSVFLLDAINPRLLDQFGPVLTLAGGLVNAYLVYVIARRLSKQVK